MQPEMNEAEAALMAEQTVFSLVQDTEQAGAVRLANAKHAQCSQTGL